jgi:hypothetical protein
MAALAVDPSSDVAVGRLVRRFAIAQVVLAALFGTLWWSGVVAPRVSLGSASSGSHDPVTGRTTAEVHLRNASPFAVTIRGAALPDENLTVDSAHVDGVDVALGGRRLAAGAEATMLIEFTCRPTTGDDRPSATPPPPTWTGVEIEATTPLGLERSHTVGTIPLFHECVS